MSTYKEGCLKVNVSYGTIYEYEVDETLKELKKHNLVKKVDKTPGVDCFNYLITFVNAEGAFLFGKTRPQLKLF